MENKNLDDLLDRDQTNYRNRHSKRRSAAMAGALYTISGSGTLVLGITQDPGFYIASALLYIAAGLSFLRNKKQKELEKLVENDKNIRIE